MSSSDIIEPLRQLKAHKAEVEEGLVEITMT